MAPDIHAMQHVVKRGLYPLFLELNGILLRGGPYDEGEHMKTMQFCQQPGSILRAPSEVAACAVSYKSSIGDSALQEEVDCIDEASEADRTCEAGARKHLLWDELGGSFIVELGGFSAELESWVVSVRWVVSVPSWMVSVPKPHKPGVSG